MNKPFSSLSRRLGVLAAMAAGILVSSCGGGTQVDKFKPQRMVSFGDESSLINADQSIAGVNYYVLPSTAAAPYTIPATGGVYDCTANPVWVQTLAMSFGMNFKACNTTGAPEADMQATPTATTQSVVTATAGYPFRSGDLVTVLVGANDIVASYKKLYPTSGAATSTLSTESNNLQNLGVALGNAINGIIAHDGTRVLVVTVPDLGLSPTAAAAVGAAFAIDTRSFTCDNQNGTTAQTTLSTLTDCFNTGLRLALKNDGTRIGLVTADSMVRDISRNTDANTNGGFTDAHNPACDFGGAAPDYTCGWVVSAVSGHPVLAGYHMVDGPDPSAAGNGNNHLWAYDTWLSPGGNAQLAARARNRFDVNPF